MTVEAMGKQKAVVFWFGTSSSFSRDPPAKTKGKMGSTGGRECELRVSERAGVQKGESGGRKESNMAMGQNPVPSVNIPIPTKID